MAGAAVYPLKLTIDRLLDSYRISIESPSREILECARNGVKTAIRLVKFVASFRDMAGSKCMEAEIREAASGLEYVLDCLVSDQILLSQSQTENTPLLISLDLEGVKQEIDGFTQKMKALQKLFRPSWDPEEDEEEAAAESFLSRRRLINWFASEAASTFLGMEADYIQELDSLLPRENEKNDNQHIRDVIKWWWANEEASVKEPDNHLPEEDGDADFNVSSRTEFSENLVGVTDMFCKIRESVIKGWYRHAASIYGMAGIGKTALALKILQDPLISSCFESCIFLRLGPKYKVQNIAEDILALLSPHLVEGVKRVLIVLDDVWSEAPWAYLERDIEFRKLKPPECRFLVTTRLRNVAIRAASPNIYYMQLLNNKESWDLLQGRVFAGKACPRELEKAGKKIAENCEGLPLLIITVADLLSKAERTPDHWTRVAASKKHSIFIEAYEKILEVVYPSYSHLPQHLQTCFLYMGAFPQNCEVRISKLMNLWSAEGLDDYESYNYSRHIIRSYLEGLISDSVALAAQRCNCLYGLKACGLHSVFWYLSKREGWNEKFLHVLDSHLDAIEHRRRLSVYENAIFSIKHVSQSIASISGVRSLLCTGSYHPYEVPIWFCLRLLKVLDALTIRFYEFPPDVLKLVLLRYLALTCNGNLPSSISKLWGLQCLIVHPHQSINSSISESFVPVEIWDLLELEYLQIMGRNLPDPPPGAVLTKLMILYDVGAHTCTKRVFGSIPNLDRLRVQIELMPGAVEPPSVFDDICLLQKLDSLQCVILNPELAVALPPLVPTSFPKSLTKLTLSGFGYPWKHTGLPKLQVLKLRCYAFRGEEWEVGEETEFPSLLYFSIEDTDLVEWTGGSQTFSTLIHLTIKNCYKLQKIPLLPRVTLIKVVDCNPSVVSFAKQMAPNLRTFEVESSWLDSGN